MPKEKISIKIYLAIIAAGVMSFCGILIETAMNITFPTVMKEFQVSTDIVQWLTTAYLLVIATIVPISSFLKRKFSNKILFIVANLLFIVGTTLAIFAPSFIFLLVGRIIQGIGTGISLPLMFNIILEQAPREKLGSMMGLGSLITAIAPALGPTFGGVLLTTLGWRYIFIFILPILIISLIIGISTISSQHVSENVRFDVLSFLFIGLTFFGLIYGISNISKVDLVSPSVLGSLIIGLASLTCFVVRSKGLKNPLLDLSVFKSSSFTHHALNAFLFLVCMLGISFLIPNYIQIVNRESAFTAGLLVLPGASLGAILSPVAGKVLDKVGSFKPLCGGTIVAIIGMLGFSLLGRSLNLIQIVLLFVIYFAGLSFVMGNTMTTGLKGLSQKQVPSGNAIFNTIQQFAGAVGTSVVSTIVSAAQGNSTGTSYITRTAFGSQYSFFFLLFLLLICLLSLFSLKFRKEI
ncbi:DHA2 family efflux MFS transporter permease subunit [Lactobacillus sp. UCMA15818]|uniref:DHA2 family efflux MFS transporter permease subunit n=1 Tax=Lactobacillus sp. UCMA15818 TaxID=2583394 RepID=UPI0025B1C227|nr:DHA2 family efflux MFS transporter permease subunit [Lactobacillus sp. UCMA15818]MDN2452240.1 multidrug efflux MFS transporter [Lactobacillus sp. UCMA15818]